MAATDRYVCFRDGKIFLVEENDGWSYMSNPDRSEKQITLKLLKENYDEELYQSAIDHICNWFDKQADNAH
jgi:hypothetical protein